MLCLPDGIIFRHPLCLPIVQTVWIMEAQFHMYMEIKEPAEHDPSLCGSTGYGNCSWIGLWRTLQTQGPFPFATPTPYELPQAIHKLCHRSTANNPTSTGSKQLMIWQMKACGTSLFYGAAYLSHSHHISYGSLFLLCIKSFFLAFPPCSQYEKKKNTKGLC